MRRCVIKKTSTILRTSSAAYLKLSPMHRRHFIFDNSRGFENVGTVREARCRCCGDAFQAFRRGRRGCFPLVCSPECKRAEARAKTPRAQRRGRPRNGRGYHRNDGTWIASPTNDRERSFPTSHRSGRIMGSHVVWNRAYPEDLVQPGQVVQHINGDRSDVRIENLRKLKSMAAQRRARRHPAPTKTGDLAPAAASH
jgi:hypothetical protein